MFIVPSLFIWSFDNTSVYQINKRRFESFYQLSFSCKLKPVAKKGTRVKAEYDVQTNLT